MQKKSPNCKHVLTFGIMYVFLPMTAIYTIMCVKLQHGVPGFKHVIYSTTLYPHAVPGKILGKLLGKLLVKHKICVFAGRMIMHKLWGRLPWPETHIPISFHFLCWSIINHDLISATPNPIWEALQCLSIKLHNTVSLSWGTQTKLDYCTCMYTSARF